jgi:hypothetical protein
MGTNQGFASGKSSAGVFNGTASSIRGANFLVAGVFCGVVEAVGETAPLIGSLRDLLRSWESSFAPSEAVNRVFLTNLFPGWMDERMPGRGLGTIDAGMEHYKAYMMGGKDDLETRISQRIRGRRFFQTASHLGHAPACARAGKLAVKFPNQNSI